MTDLPLLTFGPDAGGVTVDLERLLITRLLIQASSGGGKSWGLRYLLEQTQDRVQQLVLDHEGEFASLRERHPYLLVGAQGELPAIPGQAHVLARRLMALGSSAIIDLSDLALPDRQLFVKGFCEGLIDLPQEEWHAVLVALDEVQMYAPETGRGESVAKPAVAALANLGRKRGQGSVFATQRIANVDNNVLAAVQNRLIGMTVLDTDVRRASQDLGFASRVQRQSLKTLEPGEFFAMGPAISREPILVRTGAVTTTHPRPGSVMPPAPPAPEAIRALASQLADLSVVAEGDLDLDGARRRIAVLERQVASATGDEHVRAEVARLTRELADRQAAIENMELGRDRRLAVMAKMRDALGPVLAELDIILGERQTAYTPSPPEKLCPGCGVVVGAEHLVNCSTRGVYRGDTPREQLRARAVPRIDPVPREHRRAPPTSPAPRPERQAVESDAGKEVAGKPQQILDAIATFEMLGVPHPKRLHVAPQVGYTHVRTKNFLNMLGSLRSSGLIEARGEEVFAAGILFPVFPKKGRRK